uniref:Chromosome 6 open reading frame 58 n=1 Tax=Malurus cyaneus samueli TaxID=2593467 RepID=A0A8C5T2I8_9PASS
MWPCFGIHALLVVTVTLSPVTAAVWSGNDVTGEDAYPPLWDLAVEKLQDFPVKDGKIVINAWSYQERLGVYKSLLNASAKYFGAFGPQNSGNILWGLPLQHGWQFRTGRLADPSGVTSCGYENGEYLCQSVRSWWSCKYIQFHSSSQKSISVLECHFKIFLHLFYYNTISALCNSPSQICCKTSVGNTISYLLSTEHNSVSSATFSSFKLDDALALMWKAHTTSIAYALPKFQDSLKYLSGPEATFGDDWANGVDFIAATHFRTDLPTTNNFQAFLPPRMLVEQDVIPFISDFSPQQNKVLVSLRALHKANKSTGMSLTYKCIMSSYDICGPLLHLYLLQKILSPVIFKDGKDVK